MGGWIAELFVISQAPNCFPPSRTSVSHHHQQLLSTLCGHRPAVSFEQTKSLASLALRPRRLDEPNCASEARTSTKSDARDAIIFSPHRAGELAINQARPASSTTPISSRIVFAHVARQIRITRLCCITDYRDSTTAQRQHIRRRSAARTYPLALSWEGFAVI